MSHELIDAVTGERMQAAVDRTLSLRAENGAAPLETLAWTAVEEVFCSCVTGAEDAAEKQLSAIHATLVADVCESARRWDPSLANVKALK